MSQSEDMEAVNRYIASAPLKTKEAGRVHDEWRRWYDGLSWLEKSWDSETWDRARNLRNQFNRANAVTAVEKERAENQIRTGLTTEEIAGGVRRTLSTGDYDVPLLSSSTRLALGGALALAGIGLIAVKAAGQYLKPLRAFSR